MLLGCELSFRLNNCCLTCFSALHLLYFRESYRRRGVTKSEEYYERSHESDGSGNCKAEIPCRHSEFCEKPSAESDNYTGTD